MHHPQIVRANLLVTEAETRAAAPGHDFAAAEAKLVAARQIAIKARSDATLWPKIRDDRAHVEAVKAGIEALPDVVAIMTASVTTLTDAKDAIDTKVAGEDFQAASKLASDARAAADRIRQDRTTAQGIVTVYKTTYTDEVGKVTGADSGKAQSQIDLLNTKHAQYLAALAAGNYRAARNLITEMGWAIDAAKRLLAEHTTYEVARTAAEASDRPARGAQRGRGRGGQGHRETL